MRTRGIVASFSVFLTLLCVASGTATAVPASVKLAVNEDGLYVVTGAMLQEAGVALEQLKPSQIGISCAGQPVARHLLASCDSIVPSSSIPTAIRLTRSCC